MNRKKKKKNSSSRKHTHTTHSTRARVCIGTAALRAQSEKKPTTTTKQRIEPQHARYNKSAYIQRTNKKTCGWPEAQAQKTGRGPIYRGTIRQNAAVAHSVPTRGSKKNQPEATHVARLTTPLYLANTPTGARQGVLPPSKIAAKRADSNRFSGTYFLFSSWHISGARPSGVRVKHGAGQHRQARSRSCRAAPRRPPQAVTACEATLHSPQDVEESV